MREIRTTMVIGDHKNICKKETKTKCNNTLAKKKVV